jgi:hypothetical protein
VKILNPALGAFKADAIVSYRSLCAARRILQACSGTLLEEWSRSGDEGLRHTLCKMPSLDSRRETLFFVCLESLLVSAFAVP